jgi:hypothetical protein
MKNFVLVAFIAFIFAGCQSDSQIVSQNISVAAQNFEVFRRVVFMNTMTDTYILQVEGFCSVSTEDGRVAVTIKTEKGEYLKHYLGLSGNVTYFAEQIESKKVSSTQYRVIFKPLSIAPNVEIKQ